jgi:hypothetical protein
LRDLGRTFPQHAFFMDGQGVGQENLFNVLKAYALYVCDVLSYISSLITRRRYDIEVGYCQGLAFIVAALLLNVSLVLRLTFPSANQTAFADAG